MAIEILVVDNSHSESIIDDLRKKLPESSSSFYYVTSGEEAIKLVTERDYNLVILDYNLGDEDEMKMNGFETARKLRRIKEDIHIVGYSTVWGEDMTRLAGLRFYTETLDPLVEYIKRCFY